MRSFWRWLGLNLGKHAGIVSIVGLVITVVLGAGITQLEFATGQDSYLNKDDEVYKDSVKYQDLFGGQAMLTLVSMEGDADVTALFTPEYVQEWKDTEAEIKDGGGDLIFGVVSPLTALQFTNDLILPASGDPTQGLAAQILLSAQAQEPTPEGKEVRG